MPSISIPGPAGRALLTTWAGLALLFASPAVGQQPAAPPSAEALFEPIASVLQHPRCMNCHTSTDFPRQGDAGVRHTQLVVRGPSGTGAPTLQCQTCHEATNAADGRVPGVPHWHLAPLSMAWEGLSVAQICRNIKDPAKNGGRQSLEQVIEHMKVDPLVIWAWSPGAGRTTPVISHEAFVASLEAWTHAGGPCPGDKPRG
jgi:hypothetical protein